MRGLISDIIPFSVNDGPGIRTCVFFKGCPLRCQWCHNPEAQRRGPECMVRQASCVHCGACAACPAGARGPLGEFDPSRCTGCGLCASLCPTGASRLCGEALSPRDALARILPDKPFFRARGGVTLTGGEPMAQPEFAAELAKLLSENGISIVLETCGFAAWTHFQRVLPYVSHVFYDWKETDPELHRRWTGEDNRLILENLRKINDLGVEIVLRCPVIPRCNDRQDHFQGIAALTKSCPHIRRVDLLPYHAHGNDKRAQLGLPPDGFRAPTEEEASQWQAELQRLCPVPVCR